MTNISNIEKAIKRLEAEVTTPEGKAQLAILKNAAYLSSISGHQNERALQRDLKAIERRQEKDLLFIYLGLFDIDFTKKFNKDVGYDQCTSYIKSTLDIIDDTLRDVDFPDPLHRISPVYHPHGDEIRIITFSPDSHRVYNCFERVRATVEKKGIDIVGEEILKKLDYGLTVSGAFTKWEIGKELYSEANVRIDRYSLEAKARGRNIIVGDCYNWGMLDEELEAFEKKDTEKRY